MQQRRRARARLPLLAAAMLLVHASLAPAQSDRLEFDALVQEGDLILEEVTVLKPVSEKLAREGKQIAQMDQALRDEAKGIEAGIKQFNTSMEALNAGAKEQSEQCPREIADPALLESCNTRAKELIELQQKLADQRDPLRVHREDLNGRIEKHNAASKDYAKRNQEFAQRDLLNQRDAEDWLGRAREFLFSERVAAFLTAAGNPAACSSDRLAELARLAAVPGLKRAQECLKAMKAAR
jgi:hypothetical protein